MVRQLEVVIDGRPLVGERTGIGVHTAEIARRLPITPSPLIASHAPISDRAGIEDCRFRVDRAVNGIAWQQLILPRIAGDVVWGPHGTLPLALRRPAVITIHDLTSITMPRRHRLKTIVSFDLFVGRSLEKAARIACVSRLVANELIRGFAVDPRRVALVPNGVDEFFSPGGADGGEYILYVGTIEPRKEIDSLMGAWRALPAPRPRLVLCGGAGWGSVDTRGAEITGYVTRERLRELYRAALAFVYPSRAEGFGLPPLEAMACGAPVIATATGVVPELTPGAALVVPPGDGNALREALARLVRDRMLRVDLRHRGIAEAARWRWEPSAETMATLLAEAAR